MLSDVLALALVHPPATPLTDPQVLYQALVAEASVKAAESVKGDLDLYWILLSGFVTFVTLLIGFFGFTQFKDIKARLREEITRDLTARITSDDFSQSLQRSVERSLLGELKNDTARLERQIELSRLQRIVDKGDLTSNKSPEARTELFDRIWLLKDDQAVTKASEYVSALGMMLEVIYQTSDWDRADRLDEALRGLISKHSILFRRALTIYAFRSLAEVQNDEHCLKALTHYADVCRTANYLEDASSYALPFDYHMGGDVVTPRLLAAFDDLSHLQSFEIETFVTNIDTRSDARNLSGTPTPAPQHFRMAGKIARFKAAFQPQLARLKQQVDTAASPQTEQRGTSDTPSAAA